MSLSKYFGRYADYVYPLARIVVGFLFACHGAQKLFGVLGVEHSEIHDPEGVIAGIVEFGGGLLVMLGLWANVAAFLASGEMAVAYFKAHAPRGFWPILNGGEKAVFYCFFFLYVAARGSGRFSLDSLWRKNKRTGEAG